MKEEEEGEEGEEKKCTDLLTASKNIRMTVVHNKSYARKSNHPDNVQRNIDNMLFSMNSWHRKETKSNKLWIHIMYQMYLNANIPMSVVELSIRLMINDEKIIRTIDTQMKDWDNQRSDRNWIVIDNDGDFSEDLVDGFRISDQIWEMADFQSTCTKVFCK